jgi:uncharacterized protein YecE (DUF72 family)
VLGALRGSRAIADPAIVAEPRPVKASRGFAYYRLHGQPRRYYSSYSAEYLRVLLERLKAARAAQTWCIFDNTAFGAAWPNALAVKRGLPSNKHRTA